MSKNMLSQLVYTAKEYSPALAAMKVVTTASNMAGAKLHTYPAGPYRHGAEMMERLLRRKYGSFLEQWRDEHPLETAQPFGLDAHIPAWQCWLQDIDTMPPLLQRIRTLQEQALHEYDVHLVSYANIDDYVELPGYIHDKLHDGSITPVHFTDLVRVSLLEQYGGVWMDATVLPVRPVSKGILSTPFYTVKGPTFTFATACKYPEINRWEGYFIAGQQHALLYRWMKDFLFEYWKREDILVHYLMVNQAALLGIDHIPPIREEYKVLPRTNQSCEMVGADLADHRFSSLNAYTADGTAVFKLSRRDSYDAGQLETLFAQAQRDLNQA